jgi:hypothetical protein
MENCTIHHSLVSEGIVEDMVGVICSATWKMGDLPMEAWSLTFVRMSGHSMWSQWRLRVMFRDGSIIVGGLIKRAGLKGKEGSGMMMGACIVVNGKME